MNDKEFKKFVLEMLNIYKWSGDGKLRRALGYKNFVRAFHKRCEEDENRYHVVFSDAVYWRIPEELCSLEYYSIKSLSLI